MRKMHRPSFRKRSLSGRLDLYLKARGKTSYRVLRAFALEYNQHAEKFSEQDRKNLKALWRKNGILVEKNETPENMWMMLEAKYKTYEYLPQSWFPTEPPQVLGRSGAVEPPLLSSESPQLLGRT